MTLSRIFIIYANIFIDRLTAFSVVHFDAKNAPNTNGFKIKYMANVVHFFLGHPVHILNDEPILYQWITLICPLL